MTEAEKHLVELLAEAWNAFVFMPIEHPCDRDEFCRGIHALQEKVLARPARREINKPTTE